MIKSIKEVIAEKDLLFILAKRDITVRYKQTVLGILWAVIRPVATMFVFIFAFKQIPALSSTNKYPFQLILFSGILVWNYFANSFQAVSNSLLVNSNLISKVYFPRLIIAFSSIAVSLLDLLIGLVVYMILCIYFQYPITFNILYFPLVIIVISFFFHWIRTYFRFIFNKISRYFTNHTNCRSVWFFCFSSCFYH